MALVLLAILFFVALSLTASSAQRDCRTQLTWSTGSGNVLLNGKPFVLKGVSWFGFETETHAPHGLWAVSLASILDFLAANNFNAVRFPFSMEMVMNNPATTSIDCNINPTICHLNALDLLEVVIDQCAARGILVMPDSQFLSVSGGIPELWYDNGQYTEANVLRLWDVLMTRFGGKWNLFAIDLKNEPHGRASWGMGRQSTDWNSAVERFITHIGTAHRNYRGLFFVEGIEINADTPNTNSPPHYWGENLEGVQRHPIRVTDAGLQSRVVYSPHVYGPDVYNMPYFQGGDFPGNMPAIWQMHFGYVQALTGHPVVIGEWGGRYRAGTLDETWANAFAAWMKRNCFTNSFYWCLNPNGGDTGGLLLDDWRSPDTRKIALLKDVIPTPTVFTTNFNQICAMHGTFSNATCGGVQEGK